MLHYERSMISDYILEFNLKYSRTKVPVSLQFTVGDDTVCSTWFECIFVKPNLPYDGLIRLL